MIRTSALLATGLLLSAASFATIASAGPVSRVETVRLCPAGSHAGYLGKYCWHNRNR
jgi:hypothetical protein